MPYITSVEQLGFQRGVKEERQAVALNLLREGVPIAVVARATRLPLAQVEQLQATLAQRPEA